MGPGRTLAKRVLRSAGVRVWPVDREQCAGGVSIFCPVRLDETVPAWQYVAGVWTVSSIYRGACSLCNVWTGRSCYRLRRGRDILSTRRGQKQAQGKSQQGRLHIGRKAARLSETGVREDRDRKSLLTLYISFAERRACQSAPQVGTFDEACNLDGRLSGDILFARLGQKKGCGSLASALQASGTVQFWEMLYLQVLCAHISISGSFTRHPRPGGPLQLQPPSWCISLSTHLTQLT